jgi:hypothetical protein
LYFKECAVFNFPLVFNASDSALLIECSIVEKHQKSCDRVRAPGAFFVLALRRFLLKSGLLRG